MPEINNRFLEADKAVAVRGMDQPRPEPSPWRTLLPRLGIFFALTNLCLVPSFLLVMWVALTGMFGGKPSPYIAWQPALVTVFVGLLTLVPAQGALASLCLAWSTGSLWRRLGTYWLIALGGLACFLLGFPVALVASAVLDWSDGEFNSNWWQSYFPERLGHGTLVALAYCTQMPMLLLAVQLPFWGLRFFAHSRFALRVSTTETPGESGTESLTIRDLLLATAIVAATLGLLQFGDRTIAATEGQAEKAFLFTIFIASAVALVISLMIALPVALLFLSRLSLAVAWGITLAAAGLIAVLWFCVVQALAPSPGALELFGVLCLIMYSSLVSYSAGLTLLRRAGWQLVGRARRSP